MTIKQFNKLLISSDSFAFTCRENYDNIFDALSQLYNEGELPLDEFEGATLKALHAIKSTKTN